MSSAQHKEIIEKYFVDVIKSTKVLYENALHGQLLIVMLATIDSFGLLDASNDVTKASGETFQKWVKKYFMKNSGVEYTELDLWACRCALLHTYTSESALSKKGKAKEILFYTGDKFSQKANDFILFASMVGDDKHVAASIEETVLTFTLSCQRFARDLSKKCEESEVVLSRVRNILNRTIWMSL